MIDSTFWNEQAERFHSLRQQIMGASTGARLGAGYHPEGWGLDGASRFWGTCGGRWMLDSGLLAFDDQFKSIASVCAVALETPHTDDAWTEWLECIRRDGFDFEADGLVVESALREWRPEPDIDLTPTGLLSAPERCKPDPEPLVTSTQIGSINDVYTASERLCRRLADEALKGELSSRTHETAVSHGVVPVLPKVSVIPESVRPPRPAQPLLPSPLPAHARPVPSPLATAGLDTSKAMTLKEAAKALGVSEDTVLRMQDRGEIALFKAGSRWKVLASEVFRIRQQPRFEYR